MKRVIWSVCIVLAVSIAVYAAETMTHVGDYNMDTNASGAGLRVYTMAAKWLTSGAACTTEIIDGQRFVEMSLFISRNTDNTCDSARLHIYRDRSFDANDWIFEDSVAYAGKTADTLGVIKDWTTAKPAVYYRWRFFAVAAANESTYIKEARWILQQK